VQGPVRVLLADDQTMFREGLAELLTTRLSGMEVVGQSGTGSECVALARELKPDVTIMQLEDPLEETELILSEILEISPPPRLIILTMFAEPRVVRKLVELGASAYLLKSYSVEQLIGAIRAAIFTSSDESAIVALPRQVLASARDSPGSPLTEREMEILLLAARGLTNRQIARELHLAETTVKRHLVNVYKKMGVGSRSEAIAKALSEGWLTLRNIAPDRHSNRS
jgi:DNA-binding NarL/FixJ family response regulator